MSELTQAHIDKITALRTQTYVYVTAKMPEWRQLKWNQYIAYYDRTQGNITKLKPHELGVMKTMLNPGETPLDGYNRAIAGLEWLSFCILYHDRIEKKIIALREVQVAGFDITAVNYPVYPLASI